MQLPGVEGPGAEGLREARRPGPDPARLAAPRPWVLLVDDGELDDLREIAESLGAATARHAHDQAEAGWRQPQRLLVVSCRRAPGLGRPIAQEQDRFRTLVVLDRTGPALRDRIRRMGFDWSVERPVEIGALRALVRDALYNGPGHRRHRRLPVGHPVTLRAGWRRRDAQLVDLDARGCAVRLAAPLVGARDVTLEIPAGLAGGAALMLPGDVIRECSLSGGGVLVSLALAPDASVRDRLDALLGALASGPPRFAP